MISLWLLLLLLLQATSAGKLTEAENELRKEKCKPVESQAGTRSKRRQPIEASDYPFAAALSWIAVDDSVRDLRTGKAQELHTVPMCSGVLISTRHILTAAHCVHIDTKNSCSLNLRPAERPVGSIGFFLQSSCTEAKCWNATNPFKSTSVFVNPEYKTCQDDEDVAGIKHAQNDIAVVELRENVNNAPICMPEVDFVISDHEVEEEDFLISDQEEFESIGYGKGDGEHEGIQSVRYEDVKEDGEVILAYNLTSEKNDVVGGDSGGPLIRKLRGRHYLFGIASRHVSGSLATHDDENHMIPFVGGCFADVRKHLDWICDVSGVCSETTNRHSESIPSPPWPGPSMEFQKKFSENGNY